MARFIVVILAAASTTAQPIALEGEPINNSPQPAYYLVVLEDEITRFSLEEEPFAARSALTATDPPSTSKLGLSPSQAFFLSVGATAGSIALGASFAGKSDAAYALILGGIALGPSAGNYFQGELRDAAIGAGIRTLGTGLMIGSAFALLDGPSTSALGETMLLTTAGVGATAVIVGAGYDLVTAHKNAGGVGVRPGGAGLALEVRL